MTARPVRARKWGGGAKARRQAAEARVRQEGETNWALLRSLSDGILNQSAGRTSRCGRRWALPGPTTRSIATARRWRPACGDGNARRRAGRPTSWAGRPPRPVRWNAGTPRGGRVLVTLFVAGRPVGTLADAERLLPGYVRDQQTVELRDEAGVPLETFTPRLPAEPLVPWDPSVDMAEIDRRLAGEVITLDEMKKRLGWE